MSPIKKLKDSFPKVRLTYEQREKLRKERQAKCQHDFQPKFNSMSETFSFMRCDKCGEIR